MDNVLPNRRYRRPGPGARILAMAAILLSVMLLMSCTTVDRIDVGPAEGQHLTLAGSAFGPSTLDPALVRDVESAFLARQIFRGLVRLDNDLLPVPDLASSIEVSDDGLVYRFVLHPGAVFHDGAPIDAEAVVASFNRASDPSLPGAGGTLPPAATYFSDIEGIDERLAGETDIISGIQALDSQTIEIRLRRPSVAFLAKLAGAPAAIVDVDQAAGGNWWQSANGSGPFRIDLYQAGESLHLVAHDDFYTGGPRLDFVTVLFGASAAQPMNLYESGQIDVTGVPSWAIDRVLSPRDPLHDQVVIRDQLSTTFVAFNPTMEPFDDLDVRRMIAYAIDRETLVEVGRDGRVALAEGMIPPGIGDAQWPAELYPFDPRAARDLASGIDLDATPLIVHEPGGGIASIIRAVLEREVGVTLEVIDQDWPVFADRLSQAELPALILTWVADFPDPENTLTSLLRSGSPENYLGYANPEFDALVTEAAVETDDALRRQLYLDAQNIAIRDAVVIPLYHDRSYTLVQPRVRGLDITEIGILGLETVWIEE